MASDTIKSVLLQYVFFPSKHARLTVTSGKKKIINAWHCRQSLRIGSGNADSNTMRLIHGEGDGLPGLIVDLYGDTAVLQAHSVGMHRERHTIAELLCETILPIRNVYYKSETTLPFKADILTRNERTGISSDAVKRPNPQPLRTGFVSALTGFAVRRPDSSLTNEKTVHYLNTMPMERTCSTCSAIPVVFPATPCVVEPDWYIR